MNRVDTERFRNRVERDKAILAKKAEKKQQKESKRQDRRAQEREEFDRFKKKFNKNSKKQLTEKEKEQARKNIEKAIVIGSGVVAAAAAVTVLSIQSQKNKEAMRAAERALYRTQAFYRDALADRDKAFNDPGIIGWERIGPGGARVAFYK